MSETTEMLITTITDMNIFQTAKTIRADTMITGATDMTTITATITMRKKASMSACDVS